MSKVNTLFLFTNTFPLGSDETFLEAEIPILAKEFEKVYIIPQSNFTPSLSRTIPKNCSVINIKETKPLTSLWNLTSLCILLPHFIDNWSRFSFSYCMLREELAYLKGILKLKQSLESHIDFKELINLKSIYYTYWASEWLTILGILKKENKIKKLVSRVHGFDLYEERSKKKLIRYRKFQLKVVSHLFTISNDGYNYLKTRYGKLLKEKFSVSKLGTYSLDHSQQKKTDCLHIISCSNIIEVKRIFLIIKILSQIKHQVKWTHIGNGPKESVNELKTQIKKLPKHIDVSLTGTLTNIEVKKMYQNNYFDVFINVSSSEGIPVSIMEAISFGVPIIATNVGGVSEIVTKQSGILIEKEFDTKEVADLLNNFENQEISKNEFREKVKMFWERNYNGLTNYSSFAKALKGIKV